MAHANTGELPARNQHGTLELSRIYGSTESQSATKDQTLCRSYRSRVASAKIAGSFKKRQR